MLNTTLNLGKAALKATINTITKLATTKAATKATKQAAEQTIELLTSGEVVEKLTEIASSSTPPAPEPSPTPEPSSAPALDASEPPSDSAPAPLPDPPVTLEPLAPLPITLTRILPDGDNDSGKGWQCSKYAYYLATGTRMNYAPHPDYGPCHGADMVDYLITNLGWKECNKKNGAIFSYSDSAHGHTGVVLDASTNLVSDSNTISRPLAVDSHILNLDSLGARYAEEAK